MNLKELEMERDRLKRFYNSRRTQKTKSAAYERLMGVETAVEREQEMCRLAKKLKVSRDTLSRRADGRIEWHCEHGVGHTVWYPKGSDDTHGCCGCCARLKHA